MDTLADLNRASEMTGTEPPVVYLDTAVEEVPDALIPQVRYTVDGQVLHLRLRLIREGSPPGSRTWIRRPLMPAASRAWRWKKSCRPRRDCDPAVIDRRAPRRHRFRIRAHSSVRLETWGDIVDNDPMFIAAGRPLALAACFAFLGALATRAQVASGTHVNIYGKLTLVTHGKVGPIKRPGYTYWKNHSDSWVLTYSKGDQVRVHCNTLKDEYIETKQYDQGPTKSITTDLVYEHQPVFADDVLPGSLQIVWPDGVNRALRMSNGLWVQVKKTLTTTTEFRDGRPTSVVSVPPQNDNKWKPEDWLFHLVIRDSKDGWDAVVWEPNSDDGAVTTTNDYSYYVDDGYAWLTVLATWVVNR